MTKTNKHIASLQYITHQNERFDHVQLTEEVCKGDCKWVQIRLKGVSEELAMEIALKAKHICRPHGARLIINDHVALAKEIGADGIHLGKEDMLPSEARKMVGEEMIIGGTANNFEDIERLYKEKVDYIGLGPFRFTTTKEKLAPVLGVQGYKDILEQCAKAGIHTPIVAIGGIQTDDIDDIMATGVHGIALSGAIGNAQDIPSKTKQFLEQIHKTR